MRASNYCICVGRNQQSPRRIREVKNYTDKNMKTQIVSFKKLANREDRATAKLALIARNDTIYGGARAKTLAARLNRIGSNIPADDVVSEVYSLSNYTCGRFSVCECPECGQVYLGADAAAECCAEMFADDSN